MLTKCRLMTGENGSIEVSGKMDFLVASGIFLRQDGRSPAKKGPPGKKFENSSVLDGKQTEFLDICRICTASTTFPGLEHQWLENCDHGAQEIPKMMIPTILSK